MLRDIELMRSKMVEHDYGDLGMWNQLCQKHIELIRSSGFESFKRTINFEYSQWSVKSFVDVKSIRLLLALLQRRRWPGSCLQARIAADDSSDIRWTKGLATKTRLRAYQLYVGMLWEFAVTEDRLGVLDRTQEPAFGHPLLIQHAGRLITQDLAMSSIELNSIARGCDLSSIRRCAEIGAGYGRLAWLIAAQYPALSYHIFDIPPALAVSQNYLAKSLGEQRVVPCADITPEAPAGRGVVADTAGSCYFHLPLHLAACEDRSLDLVINVSSFDEMPRAEVEKYFAWIDRTLSGFLYLKGYRFNPASGWSYRRFPYRKSWKRIWMRTDPTNPLFVEQLFRVN